MTWLPDIAPIGRIEEMTPASSGKWVHWTCSEPPHLTGPNVVLAGPEFEPPESSDSWGPGGESSVLGDPSPPSARNPSAPSGAAVNEQGSGYIGAGVAS